MLFYKGILEIWGIYWSMHDSTAFSGLQHTHASHRHMQVKYNIFERGVEKDGTLQACRDMGITMVAHSPLQQGLLTGLRRGHACFAVICMHGLLVTALCGEEWLLYILPLGRSASLAAFMQ